jgi:hypothetical protein
MIPEPAERFLPGVIFRWTFVYLAFACVGCRANGSDRAIAILYGVDGRSLQDPTRTVLQDLEKSGNPDRTINEYVEIMEKDGGYARYVVAKALFSYFSEQKNLHVLSDRASEAIAETVQIAEAIPFVIGKSHLMDPAIGWRIRPRCVIYCDDETFVLCNGLPRGWTVGGGSVSLDDREIARVDPNENVWVGNAVNLEKELLGSSLTGEHSVKSVLTIVSPTGQRITRAKEWRFYVADDAQAMK